MSSKPYDLYEKQTVTAGNRQFQTVFVRLSLVHRSFKEKILFNGVD